jgi:malonate transporter
MVDILNLALPYFGLIFISFACGKSKKLPETGLAWMNFFLLYVSLPALLFGIMSKTPFAELNNPPFLVATTLGTASAFVLALIVGRLLGRLSFREATLAGLAGAYGNIGYMSPGLALAVLGTKAAAYRIDLLLRQHLSVFDRAAPDRTLRSRSPLAIACVWSRGPSDRAESFDHVGLRRSTRSRSTSRVPVAIMNTLAFLQNAAAPVALFALGVTVALRPFSRIPWEVPGIIAVKLLIHPLIVFALMLLLGPFPPEWAVTAVLMASLPPALNAFVIARQFDTWIEPASVAVLIGTFASVITLTSVMWLIKSGQLAFP